MLDEKAIAELRGKLDWWAEVASLPKGQLADLLALASFGLKAKAFLEEYGAFFADLCGDPHCPRERCVTLRELLESARALEAKGAG